MLKDYKNKVLGLKIDILNSDYDRNAIPEKREQRVIFLSIDVGNFLNDYWIKLTRRLVVPRKPSPNR
jgi:hypothetical protein